MSKAKGKYPALVYEKIDNIDPELIDYVIDNFFEHALPAILNERGRIKLPTVTFTFVDGVLKNKYNFKTKQQGEYHYKTIKVITARLKEKMKEEFGYETKFYPYSD